jgi:hypothetical protein
MNLQGPIIKRPAGTGLPAGGSAGQGARVNRLLQNIQVREYDVKPDSKIPEAVHIPNRHLPAAPQVSGIGGERVNSPVDSSLDDIYSSDENRAILKVKGELSPIPGRQPYPAAPGFSVDSSSYPKTPYYQGAAQLQPQPLQPQPMSPEELDSYNRRARRAATHKRLKRAKVCLNCEFFLAYTRGTDNRHFTLCKWDGTSPWDKIFTCGTSYCGEYIEYGAEPAEEAPPVPASAEKPKRRRRSRAEIEASKKGVLSEAPLSGDLSDLGKRACYERDFSINTAGNETNPVKDEAANTFVKVFVAATGEGGPPKKDDLYGLTESAKRVVDDFDKALEAL